MTDPGPPAQPAGGEPVRSRDNPAVKALRAAAAGRQPPDRALLEGPHLLAEAVDRLEVLLATPEAAEAHPALLDDAERAGCRVRLVDAEVLAGAVATATPQGLAGLVRLEPTDPAAALRAVAGRGGFALLACAVGEPGNAGAMLRSAEAAGAGAAVLAGGVRPGHPKLLRASAGAALRLPLGVIDDPVAAVRAAAEAGLRTLAATADPAAPAMGGARLDDPCALVLGSEAHGLPGPVERACAGRVRVPMIGPTESLNVAAAAAVLCYEAARARGWLDAAAGAPRAARDEATGERRSR